MSRVKLRFLAKPPAKHDESKKEPEVLSQKAESANALRGFAIINVDGRCYRCRPRKRG